MERINFGRKNILYSIRRGNRKKTVAINITPTAQVIVLAPHFLGKDKIERFVVKKAPWILEKQAYFARLSELYPEKEFVSGEQILFLGRNYRLKLIKSETYSDTPTLVGRRMFISIDKYLNLENKRRLIRDMLSKWYFSKTKNIIKQRISRYVKIMGVKQPKFKIKEQKKRWGSCSNRAILRFNWRISMAPISVIDYIVVHELCHLKVKNHSSDFWKLVSLALPDYQRRRDWLKNNSAIFKI
jgi:predicted metal-dependent hydrolase